jgi:Trypsin-co-occurring domain 1
MTLAARVPIDGGGAILVELPDVADHPSPDGLLPAGRMDKVSEAAAVVLEEASASLQKSLESVTEFAKALRGALHAANPDGVEVEFGFDLGVQGGTPLIVRGDAACHVKVTLSWRADDHGTVN